MKKITVTIGIPAYNEEANIKYLIEDLLRQDLSGYVLERIVVNSDGSTDDTISIVKKFQRKNIEVVENSIRLGLSKVQNQIIQNTASDVLVLLNADIMIKDLEFIRKLIKPIAEENAELTSSAMEELKSPTFLGDVLNTSMKFKTSVFEKFNQGNNIYTCHGAARAFSKKLYEKIEFIDSIGEDAYSYLFALFNGFRYQYVISTKGYYRLPTNYKDHERQSIRFLQSKKKFIKEFGDEFVSMNYYLPLGLLADTVIRFLARHPIHMFLYILIYLGIKIRSVFASKISDNWEISASSKVLRLKSL